jgi:hypothetical protein
MKKLSCGMVIVMGIVFLFSNFVWSKPIEIKYGSWELSAALGETGPLVEASDTGNSLGSGSAEVSYNGTNASTSGSVSSSGISAGQFGGDGGVQWYSINTLITGSSAEFTNILNLNISFNLDYSDEFLGSGWGRPIFTFALIDTTDSIDYVNDSIDGWGSIGASGLTSGVWTSLDPDFAYYPDLTYSYSSDWDLDPTHSYKFYIELEGTSGLTGTGGSIGIGGWDGSISNFHAEATPASVPEPATFFLLGSGLIAFTSFKKRLKQSL